MRKREKHRQLKELKEMKEGKKIKRFEMPTLTKSSELRELFGVNDDMLVLVKE